MERELNEEAVEEAVETQKLSEEAVEARKRPKEPETETVAQEPQFGKYTEQKLINELARVAAREEDAETLLREADFPRSRAPRFTTPLHYWSKIVELADNGIIESGSKQLLRAAVRLFPYNKNFAEYLVDGGGDQRSKWSLRLELDEIPDSQLNEVLDILRKLSGDPSISLVRRYSGSIVLVLDIMDQAAVRLRALAESGVLLQALGPPFMSFSKYNEPGYSEPKYITELVWENSGKERRLRGILHFDTFTEEPQLEIRGRGDISPGTISQFWDKIPWSRVYKTRILFDLNEVAKITPDAHRLFSRLRRELANLGAAIATVMSPKQAPDLLDMRYFRSVYELHFFGLIRASSWLWGRERILGNLESSRGPGGLQDLRGPQAPAPTTPPGAPAGRA